MVRYLVSVFLKSNLIWTLVLIAIIPIGSTSYGGNTALESISLEIDRDTLTFLNFSSPGITDQGSSHSLILLEDGSLIVGGNTPQGINLKVEVQGRIGAEEFCNSNESTCFTPANIPATSDPWESVTGGVRLPSGVSMGIGHPSGLPEHPLTGSFEIYSPTHTSQYQTSFHFDATTSKFRTAASTVAHLRATGSGRTATFEDGTSSGQFNLSGTRPFEFWVGVPETVSGIAPMSVADGRKIGIFNDIPTAQMDICRPTVSSDKYLMISSAMGQDGDILSVGE